MTPPLKLRKLSVKERLTGRLDLSRPTVRASFLRDYKSPFIAGWQGAILREPQEEQQRVWADVTRLTADAIQNSGFLAGGVEQATTQIVGSGLSLNAKPDPSIFGGDAKAAGAWARDVERRFETWGRDPYACDITARQTLDQQCYSVTRMWFGTGEILALVRYKPKPGNTLGTKMQTLPPMRIPYASKNPNAVQGVILDIDGAPMRYCIYTPMPGITGQIIPVTEQEVAVRDETGRLIVVHVHDSHPTVVRGISPLAPALQITKQFDQLANATLTAALLQAIFAASIESEAQSTDQLLTALQSEEEQEATADGSPPPGAFDQLMSARKQWYENTNIDLGTFGKVIHLFMGEKLNFLRSEHPNANYKSFARFLLLEIARCLGITYEQLTGDREGATYSSERMGSAENWLLTQYRRATISGRYMQAAYEAWLEETIELGQTPFPGGIDAFIGQRAAAARADWRGPPKPSADDQKTAKANETKYLNKAITLEQWCADEGTDWEDVLEQKAREQERADELNVDLAPPPTGAGGATGADATGDSTGPAKGGN